MKVHNWRISLNCYFKSISYSGLWIRFCLRRISYLNLDDKITWTIIGSWVYFTLTLLAMAVFAIWFKSRLSFTIQALTKIFLTMIRSIRHSLSTLSNRLRWYFIFTTLNWLSTIFSRLNLLLIWIQTSISSSITALTISTSLPIKMSSHYILPND